MKSNNATWYGDATETNSLPRNASNFSTLYSIEYVGVSYRRHSHTANTFFRVQSERASQVHTVQTSPSSQERMRCGIIIVCRKTIISEKIKTCSMKTKKKIAAISFSHSRCCAMYENGIWYLQHITNFSCRGVLLR